MKDSSKGKHIQFRVENSGESSVFIANSLENMNTLQRTLAKLQQHQPDS